MKETYENNVLTNREYKQKQKLLKYRNYEVEKYNNMLKICQRSTITEESWQKTESANLKNAQLRLPSLRNRKKN